MGTVSYRLSHDQYGYLGFSEHSDGYRSKQQAGKRIVTVRAHENELEVPFPCASANVFDHASDMVRLVKGHTRLFEPNPCPPEGEIDVFSTNTRNSVFP